MYVSYSLTLNRRQQPLSQFSRTHLLGRGGKENEGNEECWKGGRVPTHASQRLALYRARSCLTGIARVGDGRTDGMLVWFGVVGCCSTFFPYEHCLANVSVRTVLYLAQALGLPLRLPDVEVGAAMPRCVTECLAVLSRTLFHGTTF